MTARTLIGEPTAPRLARPPRQIARVAAGLLRVAACAEIAVLAWLIAAMGMQTALRLVESPAEAVHALAGYLHAGSQLALRLAVLALAYRWLKRGGRATWARTATVAFWALLALEGLGFFVYSGLTMLAIVMPMTSFAPVYGVLILLLQIQPLVLIVALIAMVAVLHAAAGTLRREPGRLTDS